MISRIELTNYQPYLGDHAVDLQEGVTLIEASYDDDDRASNRGGKSALLEAIPFAMYGYARTTKRDVIHHEADKSCKVSVKTSLGDFTRTWTGSSFRASADAPPFMSLEAALATWFMGTGEASGLFGMDAASRKELLIPVLVRDLDVWTRLAESAESKYTVRRNGSSELQQRYAAAEARVEELERTVLEAPDDAAVDVLAAKVEELRASVDRTARTATTVRKEADALEASVQALSTPMQQIRTSTVPEVTDMAPAQAKLRSLEAKRTQLAAFLQSFTDALTRERVREEGLRRKERELDLQPTCPFTKQFCQVAEDTLEQRRSEVQTELDALMPVLVEIQSNRDSAAEAVRKLDTKLAEQREVLTNLELTNQAAQNWWGHLHDVVRANPLLEEFGLHDGGNLQLKTALIKLGTSGGLDKAIEQKDLLADQLDAKAAALREELAAVQTDLTRLRTLKTAAEQHVQRLEQAKSERDAAAAALTRNVTETKALNHLVRACSTSGIPAEIAADTARVLEAYINDTLTLVETPIRVRVEPFENTATTYERVCPVCGFTHDKSAKRGTCQSCGEPRTPMRLLNFALQYERGTSYRIESAGGRLMSDLACRIGYYRLMSALNGGMNWGTLAADEIFGSLDVPNRNEVYRFLSETLPKMQFGFRQILVVSHVPLELSGTEHRVRIQASRSERGSVRSRILE